MTAPGPLARLLGWLGLSLGLTAAIGVPAGYFLVASNQLAAQLSLASEINAGRVARFLYTHHPLWQYQTTRLADLLELGEARHIALQWRLLDPTGKIVVEVGDPPPAPTVSRSTPVVVRGSPVAVTEAVGSSRTILLETALVAVLSSLFGLAIYLAMRSLPLRIVNRTMRDLEATRQHYRLLFESNPYPMAVTDRATGHFLAVNKAALDQYGWSREEFLSLTRHDILASPLKRDRRTASPGRRLQRHRRKDGSVFDVEIMARGLTFAGVPAVLALGADVTERTVMETQLRQAQKMEAVGQLTGGVAHDFNNILMVILGNLEMMEEDDALPAHLRKIVTSIGQATERAAKLTHQLLAFSRKQVLRPERADINEIITATVSLLRRTLGAHISIDLALTPEPAIVEIDRSQMEAALVNLALNARDAMPEGGSLRISSENRKAPATDGGVAADYILVEVTDSGSGIAPEIQPRIFEPFFTTKEVGKGSGLGLSMVYGFLQQSGGYVAVRSAIGQGTTFGLYLPRKATAPDSPPGMQPLSKGSENILVVEDELGVRTAVLQMLTSLGYEAAGVDSGSAALEALQTGPLPALVLTDLIMPGPVSGARLAQQIKSRWPGVRLAFMTGYSDVDSFDLDPTIPLLLKPFRKGDVARLVRRALADPSSRPVEDATV